MWIRDCSLARFLGVVKTPPWRLSCPFTWTVCYVGKVLPRLHFLIAWELKAWPSFLPHKTLLEQFPNWRVMRLLATEGWRKGKKKRRGLGSGIILQTDDLGFLLAEERPKDQEAHVSGQNWWKWLPYLQQSKFSLCSDCLSVLGDAHHIGECTQVHTSNDNLFWEHLHKHRQM